MGESLLKGLLLSPCSSFEYESKRRRRRRKEKVPLKLTSFEYRQFVQKEKERKLIAKSGETGERK